MDLRELVELIECVDRSSLTHFELDRDGLKVRMIKERVAEAARPAPEEKPLSVEPVPAQSAGSASSAPADSSIQVVTSPMVGVFYQSPEPGSPPFVQVGDAVHKGQVLCIIEAMKLMNEVTAEVEGTVIEVLAQNEQMVEYAQPLFKVKR